ncbi:butyrophilin subfamily 2 member A2-like isoform X2 [Pimephales promelas]|uniref:butyrophilin subfamily 2 member A2-like isoform X2 n=1 Tax=Pimephales promelas TaxID=90988 RepID=UPI001955E013|nr:butyrophilin subfamily 2 member A2-like isoform X2 [Pimephales promelas]
MLTIIVALLVNLFIETSESFTVVVPRDQTVARVGSTVTLPCWISPPENAEVLEIRWYRQDQFSNPVLVYQNGKIIQEESFRNRSSLTLWSDQSGGLKNGDVSLRLEKLRIQDEGSFHCYVSGESAFDSGEVVLKVTDPPDSSDPWMALFIIAFICVLGLIGFILYKYRLKLTVCDDETMESLTKVRDDESMERETKEDAGSSSWCAGAAAPHVHSQPSESVGDTNIAELRKHAGLTVSPDGKTVRDAPDYKHTGEGFPYELCAVGAQRYKSGRRYWEVELALEDKPPKNYWLIGVTKHGNFRVKDRSAVTPSNRCWFLCSDGPNGFYTSSDPPVSLSLTPRPERLGVLLDYGEGQLSFYNVKERKHVLTMKIRFPESVSPLFNPGVGDQSSLMILDCPEPVETPVESSEPLLGNSSDA